MMSYRIPSTQPCTRVRHCILRSTYSPKPVLRMDIPNEQLLMRRGLLHSLSQLSLTDRLSPPTDRVFDDSSPSSTWQRSSPPSLATSFCSNGACPSRPQSRASSLGSDNSFPQGPPEEPKSSNYLSQDLLEHRETRRPVPRSSLKDYHFSKAMYPIGSANSGRPWLIGMI